MNKYVRLVIPACLISILFCGEVRSEAGSPKVIEVRDSVGRKVSLPENPQRVVALAPGALRLLVYMGLEERQVGVERLEVKYPRGRPYWLASKGKLERLPIAGPGGPASINNLPDIEPLMRCRPDVLFMTLLDKQKANELERKVKIPVVVLSYGDFATFDETVFDSLRLLGKIFDKSERAEEIVSFVNARIADLKRRSAKIERSPSVYVGGLGFKGTQGLGSTDASYVPFEWLSARNVAKEIKGEGHLFVNDETLLKLDPEIIFVDGGGREAVGRELVKKQKIYGQLAAFKSGSVYGLYPFNWYVTNIGTALADAYAIGKAIGPEAFEDVDVDKTADDIYAFLVGRPLSSEMAEDYGPLGKRTDFSRGAGAGSKPLTPR